MLFLVPVFALGLTVITEYLLPPEMPRRKRIRILAIIGFLSLVFGTAAVLFMFHSSTS